MEPFKGDWGSSKIPVPIGRFQRSFSLRVRGEKPKICFNTARMYPSITEEEDGLGWNLSKRKLPLNLNRSQSQANILNQNIEDDCDSLDSFVSTRSAVSLKSGCGHALFAKNGTTYSLRLHRYIVHCQDANNDPEEYLTPTQRANRSIKKLKTLLQLAKEKLREKEAEIFKLTKEVVELKVYKASLNSQFSKESSPSEPKNSSSYEDENSVIDCDANTRALPSAEESQKEKDLPCNNYNVFSPLKNSYYFDDNNDEYSKASPISPQPCFDEKLSATPDFLISSLADSGNFDDLASSVSLNSKDSVGFAVTPDLHTLPEDEKSTEDSLERSEEKVRILNAYEKKLKEKKLEYELELKRVVDEQEEKNVKMMREFEVKLKEEELKFEERWIKLLRASEDEKQMIVERFERKLNEEKEKYLMELTKSQRRKGSDACNGEAYIRTVEEEKSIYESSLQRIKSQFEKQKFEIESNFDEAMREEKKKLEERVQNVKETCDIRIAELLKTITDLENRYHELLPKYEETVSKNLELETENLQLKERLSDQEETHKNIYLKLFTKGQEAAALAHQRQISELAEREPDKIPIPELLVQLKVTEAELENLKDKELHALHPNQQGVCLLTPKDAVSLWMFAARKAMYKRLAETQTKIFREEAAQDSNAEVTLQFLKSAVYYFLTDRENHLGHLRAIESILGFSTTERINIEKNYPL